jgi:F0F1-type ATP synthase delta subunit
MYTPVLSQIRTKEEKNIFQGEIDLLKKSLFEQEENFEHVLGSKVRSKISQAIRPELEKESVDKKAYLLGLENELNKLTPLALTIAFEPCDSTISKIFDWVGANLGSNYLLDIQQDNSILGGIIITFKGEYRDYSLKSKLDQYLSQNKENLLSLVKQ